MPSHPYQDSAFLNQVLNSVIDGIYVLDTKGNIIFVNNEVVHIFGYPKKEILKMNVHQLYIDSTIDICLIDLTLARQSPQTELQTFFTATYPKGEQMMTTQIPIFDSFGKIKYCVGVIHNINEFASRYHSHNLKKPPTKYQIPPPHISKDMVIGDPKMFDLLQSISNVANSSASILITGESGVGKEVVAHHIHKTSNRRDKPFIHLNCASFPETLLEAELFGYEKGSFTGASSGKQGLIETANMGTLFLDEINSMPLSTQGKLLTILDNKKIRRIGSTKETSVDFRLITATNENLEILIAQKKFRADLYYRCNVIPVNIPPLRERPGDIRLLINHFLNYYNEKYDLSKNFSEKVYSRLESYHWPGNVRELRNTIERIVLMTDRSVSQIADLPPQLSYIINQKMHETDSNLNLSLPDFSSLISFQHTYDSSKSLREQVNIFESWIISQAIKQNGSLSKAAKKLDIDRSTLIRKRNSYKNRTDQS